MQRKRDTLPVAPGAEPGLRGRPKCRPAAALREPMSRRSLAAVPWGLPLKEVRAAQGFRWVGGGRRMLRRPDTAQLLASSSTLNCTGPGSTRLHILWLVPSPGHLNTCHKVPIKHTRTAVSASWLSSLWTPPGVVEVCQPADPLEVAHQGLKRLQLAHLPESDLVSLCA